MLKEKGVPHSPQLRAEVTESEATIRTPRDIALRLLVMYAVSVYSEVRTGGDTWMEGHYYLDTMSEIAEGKLSDHLTPEETAFVAIKEPEKEDYARFVWRYECCHVLMWALGYAKELSHPEKKCDVLNMGKVIWKYLGVDEIVQNAKPRTKEELLQAADLTMRYDRACADARAKGTGSPAGMNCDVVRERHYALNWLIGANGNADWDDIKI
ncbi:MAG: DUF4272 domain-containing protein [Candidatus Methanoplasma sp.]|nr:DUF4272 domain-containing protein [Candidatus Methanoplasma sp.]